MVRYFYLICICAYIRSPDFARFFPASSSTSTADGGASSASSSSSSSATAAAAAGVAAPEAKSALIVVGGGGGGGGSGGAPQSQSQSQSQAPPPKTFSAWLRERPEVTSMVEKIVFPQPLPRESVILGSAAAAFADAAADEM